MIGLKEQKKKSSLVSSRPVEKNWSIEQFLSELQAWKIWVLMVNTPIILVFEYHIKNKPFSEVDFTFMYQILSNFIEN